MSEKLSDELKSALQYVNEEIPSYISENLNKELRIYQEQALKHYLLQRQNPKTNHLLFNMATGSGKTLIMAALMLDLYKRGYRNFVFFVDSTAILEKTKANFCDEKSSKYLFKQDIKIDGQVVEINAITNLNDSRENAINILFITVHTLYNRLIKDEREGNVTFEDFKRHKIVFLADESHHLNSDTKEETKRKEGWESAAKKAFESHRENLMLEFTATIPNHAEVLEKYKDKIVFEYNLKSFCQEGYSKRIFLMKYEDSELKSRFLGACLLSLYRQLLAIKYEIFLKPVVLFKSESITPSKENQKNFNAMLENLQGSDVEEFYKNINLGNEIFWASLEFFKKEFENYEAKVAELIKIHFKENFQLNANDNDEADANQIKLNSLEDKDNEVRVIFAVDKLNEGWDVLNLFDIVRLNGKTKNKTTTTKEAQLIGRGARYFPFGDEEFKYVRKYDKTQEFDERSMLERLSYHSFNDVSYINQLTTELKNQGLLFDEKKELIELRPSKRAKELTDKNKIFYVKNSRYIKEKGKNLFSEYDEIKQNLQYLEVPYFSKKIEEKEEKFKEEKEEYYHRINNCFGDNICFEAMAKAMNMLNITMREIKRLSPEFKSKREFYESFRHYKFRFDKRQKFDRKNQLELTKFILQNFKNALVKESRRKYEVSEFETHELKNKGIRSIFSNKDNMQDSQYEWLYYDKWSKDSGLEANFLNFIDENKQTIDEKFEEWIILRNDGFSEFKIYDNRKDSPTYAMGFEPDFIFFGKRRGDKKKHLSVEGIMESKGEHLVGKDQWKEDLILQGLNRKIDDNLEVFALPFFLRKDDKKFQSAFKKIFEKSLFEEG